MIRERADHLVERALAVGELVANNPGPAMAEIRKLLISDDVAAIQRSEVRRA